jgi:hypothetical protein
MAAEDPEPWLTANALIGLRRALIDCVRRRVLAGDDTRRIARGWNKRGLTRVLFIGGSDSASHRTLTVGGNTAAKQRYSAPAAFG